MTFGEMGLERRPIDLPPWYVWLAALVLVILLVFVMGCNNDDAVDVPTTDRFVISSSQYLSLHNVGDPIYVMCDRKANQEYLLTKTYYGRVATPLGTTCQPSVRLMSR